MRPRIKLASDCLPDGRPIELFEHDGHHEIRCGGLSLMGSRMRHSEEELARLACQGLRSGARVLIGGLGLGFTLRATLDLLPPDGTAIQVELMAAVVEWNRGPLGHHADHPLDDLRTELVLADVTKAVRRYEDDLDAILLDVDNGPNPLVAEENAWLYKPVGLQRMRRALRPGGCLAIWSSEEVPSFPARLRKVGFCDVEAHRVTARPNGKGPRHAVFLGRRP